MLEEVLKKNIPIIIFDPHNEYSTLKFPNGNKKDIERLKNLNLKPEGFSDKIKEFSPDTKTNPHAKPINLDIKSLSNQDFLDSFPQKLSPTQQNLLFNILSNTTTGVNFDELIFALSNEENNSKWTLISQIEQLKKINLFSNPPTKLEDIVKHKQCSIISLKGVEPYICELFCSTLLRNLFEKRKREEIPSFLLVLEEAHNFCPEASLGKLKSTKIIRTLAGEGRKFGIGLCVISQRPAKVDKNVISQCTTQILLKITNPNDLKSVIASSEGVDSSSEQEIQKLNIGTCLLTGLIDIPLKINVRPRVSKHGGETVTITMPYEKESKKSWLDKDFMSKFIGFAWGFVFVSGENSFILSEKPSGFKFKFLSLSISFLFPFGNFKVEYSLWGSKIIIGIFFFKTSSSKTPTQQNLLFNILSNTTTGVNFDELIFALSNEENNSKWTLISQIEQLKKINLFSNPPTKLEDIVKHKQCSIISLKGVEPYICELFCSTLLRNLFEKRKREEIPPFLLVLEEAHNFLPRSFPCEN